MPCKSYKHALTDAAAANATPSRELVAHLNICSACRTFFTAEQELFAAIQAGVTSHANGEPPSLFLQRARARLANETAARPGFPHWTMFATVGLASIAVIFVVLLGRHSKVGNRGVVTLHESNILNSSAAKTSTFAAAFGPASGAHATRPQAKGGARTLQTSLAMSKKAHPAAFEVIVPPEEREGLARYIAAQKRTELPADGIVASSAPFPAQIAPLEIADLEVKPMPDLGGETPDLTREK